MPTPSEVLDIKFLGSDLATMKVFPMFEDGDLVMLPIIDTETKKSVHPNYIKHYKFSIPVRNAKILDEYPDTMLYTVIQDYLQEIGESEDRFVGKKYIAKTGLFAYENPYRTAVRLWTSYKVKNEVIYEATIVGYPVSD